LGVSIEGEPQSVPVYNKQCFAETHKKPCAEKLFMDLAKNYKDELAQPLVNVFNSIAGTKETWTISDPAC